MKNEPFYNYSSEYIEIIELKYILIKAFLVEASTNLLDISYSIKNNKLVIQVVLLEDTELEDEEKILLQLREELSNLDIRLCKLFVSKNDFNKDKGNWPPTCYDWLEYVLFSKAEIL